jgi:teichuronic acid biosynthesis glycosyltransferase TuaC
MRALVVTNMWPSPEAPARGSFVRDQVAALRALPGIEVEVFAFPPGGYARAALALRRRHGGDFDVVHAHFGLTAWPALAVRGAAHAVTLHGTDVRHPRSRRITQAALPFMDLIATVSAPLAEELDRGARSRRAGEGRASLRHAGEERASGRCAGAGGARRAGARRAGPRRAVLPCGVDTTRFVPLPRTEARERLGLDPAEPCLLFPADPARAVKRADRAREVAGATRLLTLGQVEPADVPLWVNAASAVLVPSDAEGFGLAVLEALACDVPVLATPVGAHPAALAGIAGTLCAPYDREAWRTALEPHLTTPDPRVEGRARAAWWSAEHMARRVVAAWSELIEAPVYSAAEAPVDGALSV